jgi:hypothetical protein
VEIGYGVVIDRGFFIGAFGVSGDLAKAGEFRLEGFLLVLLLGGSKGLDFLYFIAALLTLASLRGVKLNGRNYQGDSDADLDSRLSN